MSGSCTYEGCTVDETGICALERDPGKCSNRNRSGASASTAPASVTSEAASTVEVGSAADLVGAPVLATQEKPSAFPSSTTLGAGVVEDMMASRYVTVVGILGEPDAGKTACLASLYLQISHDRLDGWTFADSASLMGFEDIARGAREWTEESRAQLTVRTEISSGRHAGFLHLRLKRRSDGRRVDFAMPDLPGEWSDALVKSSRMDGLEFLSAAEAIWLVVDGRGLRRLDRRQGVITRLGQLACRLRTLTGAHLPRMLVVVSHRDLGELPKELRDRLTKELGKHGIVGEIVEIAPFTDDEASAKAGFGIAELIDATVGPAPVTAPFWRPAPPSPGGRAYLGYRRDQ